MRCLVWDLETTDLNAFMGRVIVGSFLDLSAGKMLTHTILDYGKLGTRPQVAAAEKKLVGDILDILEEGDVFIGHNTKGFDCGFLRGRAEVLGLRRRVPKRQHWDTYQIARHAFKGRPGGYSMGNLADFFGLPEQKDKPSKHDWEGSTILDPTAVRRIAQRCESDVRVNAEIWYRLRPYFHEWRGT